jgi:hypothetical protein
MRLRNLILFIIALVLVQTIPGQEPKPSPTATPEKQEPKTFTGVPPGFEPSPYPTSWLLQTWIPRRNPRRTSEVENKPANVTALNLEKDVVYSPCFSESNATCTGDEAKILITTSAEDKENDVVTYAYTVGAGKIVGQGVNVIWDLSGVPTGDYTITAGVNDGCGVCGTTLTKTVTVKGRSDVESIKLSDYEIFTLCPGTIVVICPKEQMIVDVTTATKAEYSDLTYYYAVTGGKIVGTGANVKWDLTNAEPGTYSITVGIGKNRVIRGKTATTTLVKRRCECDPGCDCGDLSIEGPGSARPGDTIVVTATVRGGPDVTYKWMIPAGAILNAPNGSSIMVKIPADFKEPVFTATVELSGTDPKCNCETRDTVTVRIEK